MSNLSRTIAALCHTTYLREHNPLVTFITTCPTKKWVPFVAVVRVVKHQLLLGRKNEPLWAEIQAYLNLFKYSKCGMFPPSVSFSAVHEYILFFPAPSPSHYCPTPWVANAPVVFRCYFGIIQGRHSASGENNSCSITSTLPPSFSISCSTLEERTTEGLVSTERDGVIIKQYQAHRNVVCFQSAGSQGPFNVILAVRQPY